MRRPTETPRQPTLQFTLKQLRTFATVARSRTLAAAADSLGITPPAVTIQLRLLEDGVGLPLLERSAAGHRLTAAGQEVLEAASRIDHALVQCDTAIQQLKGLERGSATLGVISPAQYFAPAMLAAFRRSSPQIDLGLVIGNRADMIAALGAHTVDFVIMGQPPDALEVESHLLGDNPHVIVAPRGHALAARRQLPLAAVAKEPFLVRERGSGTRQLMESRLAEAGIRLNVAMEISNTETIKQAVMAGLGLAFVSAHTVASEVTDGRLVMLDVVGLPIMRQWHLVRNVERRLLPAAEQFRAFLVAELPRLLPVVPTTPASAPVKVG